MAMNQTYNNKIDDYITGRLPMDEVVDFERELKYNPELRREVEITLAIYNSINEEDTELLREKLNNAKLNVKRKKLKIPIIWFAAASVSIIIFLSLFLFQSKPSNPNELFNEYYKRFDIPSESRGVNELDEFKQISARYNAGEYEMIIPMLEEMFYENNHENLIGLMLVSAYLESNHADLAEKLIEGEITSGSAGLFNETYNWYLVMSYLKQSKTDKAAELLKTLKSSDSKYSTNAANLYDSLGKLH